MPDNSASLIARYNRALARNDLITEQFRKEEDQIKKSREASEALDVKIRKLCASILGEDPDPETDTLQLIALAQAKYDTGFDKWSGKIKLASDRIRESEEEIKDLEERKRRLLEGLPEVDPEEEKKEEEKPEDAGKKTETSEKEKREKKTLTSMRNSLKKGQERKEAAGLDDIAMDAAQERVEKIQVQEGQPSQSRESDNRKRKQERLDERKNEIDDTLKNLSPDDMRVFEAIGKHGCSEVGQIVQKITENGKEEKDPTPKVRTSLDKMVKMKLVNVKGDCKAIMLNGAKLYRLSEAGKEIYERKTGKKPTESEYEAIVREHGTPDHGYGIRAVARLLMESDFVKSRHAEVEYLNNRKKIQAGEDTFFIPDITIRWKNRDGKEAHPVYLEYETTKTDKSDFFDKCNKYFEYGNKINIIVPANEEKERVIKGIASYVRKAEEDGILKKNIYFRVSTYNELKKALSTKGVGGERKESELSFDYDERFDFAKRSRNTQQSKS